MSATAGVSDRTTLSALDPNLIVGATADPALRYAVFHYLFDLADANWSDYAAFKNVLYGVDGGNFTDTFSVSDYAVDGGAF